MAETGKVVDIAVRRWPNIQNTQPLLRLQARSDLTPATGVPGNSLPGQWLPPAIVLDGHFGAPKNAT